MKKLVLILWALFFYTGPAFAQDSYLENFKKWSLSRLELERAEIKRQIQHYKHSSDGFVKAYVATREKHLRLINEEIARRPRPKNPATDDRNDVSSDGEKQQRADRVRMEEQRLRQRAYEAAMARTQPYYDNLKANAAYHASAEGVAVASAVVDPSHYMNPGQAEYIPSVGPPRVQARDRRVVRQRLQQLRSMRYADAGPQEEETGNEETESRALDENGLARLEQMVNDIWMRYWKRIKNNTIQWGYDLFYTFAPDHFKNGRENWAMSRDIISYQRLLTDSNYRRRIMNQAADPRARSTEWYFDDWYRNGYKSLERINTRIGNRVPSQYSPLNRVRRTNLMIKSTATGKVKEYVGKNGGGLMKIFVEKE